MQKVFWRRVCSNFVQWWPAGSFWLARCSQLFKDAVSMMKAGGRSGNKYCKHFGAVAVMPLWELWACFKHVLLCCVGRVVWHHRHEVRLAHRSRKFSHFFFPSMVRSFLLEIADGSALSHTRKSKCLRVLHPPRKVDSKNRY